MAPHFLHLRANSDQAIALLEDWFGGDKPHYDADLEAEDNGWVTLSIDLDYQPIEEWLALGVRVDLLYESYSTSLLTGEIVYISSQHLLRHLALDANDPVSDVDVGMLRAEHDRRFQTWDDIWGFVEDWTWAQEVDPLVIAP